METVTIHKAKSNLSQLVKLAAEGETIFIGSYGKPQAALMAAEAVRANKKIGVLAGRLVVPDDFDAPLPDDVLASFEGR